ARRARADGSLELRLPLGRAGDARRLLLEGELALVELRVARDELPRVLLVDVPGALGHDRDLAACDADVELVLGVGGAGGGERGEADHEGESETSESCR